MRFLKYFLFVCGVCTFSLWLIFLVFRKGYHTYFNFEQTRLNAIINEKDYNDALFIGASRTYYHVNPQVVDSVLNIKSFNAGIDGANLLEMNMILQCYLASHPRPKYVIAELAKPAFDIKTKPFWNPNIYFPFLDNNIVFNTLKPYKRVYLLRYLPFLQFSEYDDFL